MSMDLPLGWNFTSPNTSTMTCLAESSVDAPCTALAFISVPNAARKLQAYKDLCY